MKVLFDHNLPHLLRPSLMTSGSHEISTAAFLGWGHLKNGELLSAAEDSDFEVFITGDRTMVHEQNLAGRRISIIALSTNNWPILKDFIPQILVAIGEAQPGAFVEVYCGEFSRKRSDGSPGSAG